jgi:hypothetical protein
VLIDAALLVTLDQTTGSIYNQDVHCSGALRDMARLALRLAADK